MKKILAVFLVITLITSGSVFSGCSKPAPANDNSTQNEKAAEPTVSSPHIFASNEKAPKPTVSSPPVSASKETAEGISPWLYYSGSIGLYRLNTDGKDSAELCNDDVESFLVNDGWIYFKTYTATGKEPNLFKMRLDGSERQQLGTAVANIWIAVQDGWVYFSEGIDYGIGKIRVDGTGYEKLCKGVEAFSICVSGEWIYYGDYGRKQLRRIKTDGTGDELLYQQTNDEGVNIDFYNDNYIYCHEQRPDFKQTSQYQVYRVPISGGTRENLTSGYPFKISGDWIYYYNNDDSTLWRSRIDGTESHQVSKHTVKRMMWDVIGDWIYFTGQYLESAKSDYDGLAIYRVHTDGTNEEVFCYPVPFSKNIVNIYKEDFTYTAG